MHHPGLVDLHTHTTASDGSDPPDVHLGAPAVPDRVLDALRDRFATEGPLCVGSAQNDAKRPKGGTT
jgi:hypothetical protein